jgi:hypothetical protein
VGFHPVEIDNRGFLRLTLGTVTRKYKENRNKNMEIDLKEIWSENGDWINLAQDSDQ